MAMDLLRLAGQIELTAAAGDGKSPKRFEILAYSGGPMSPPGWPHVVIDLAGADVSGDVPILAGHAEDLDSIVGQGQATIRDHRLHVSGVVTDATPAGQKVITLNAAGINLQASVGYAPDRREHVPAGQTVAVNGRTIKSGERGLTIIRSGKLREVSLLPIGADPDTRVRIAAKAASSESKGFQTMTFDEYLATKGYHDPSVVSREMQLALRGGYDAEHGGDDPQRFARIEAVCREFTFADKHLQARADGLKLKALDGTIGTAGLQAGLLSIARDEQELGRIRGERPKGPGIRSSGLDTDPVQCAAAGLLLKAGFSGAAKRQFGEPVLQAADRMRKGSLLGLAEECLRADGVEKPHGREAMVKAAFSTVSMPAALGLAGEKILLDAFREAPAPWREWCKIVSVQSFREHTLLRPSFLGGFEPLTPAGEIAHGHVGEETAVIQADTFAKLLRIDRQSIINDDAGAFGQAAAAMGRAAARKLNDLVIQVLLAGSGTFFTTPRGNLLTDALSVTAVAEAIAVLRAQTDPDGGSLDILPRVLLVGPGLESLAVAICNSDFVGVTDGSPTGNSLKGLLIPKVEPRLANATLGGSATTWAVLAAPVDSPQAVAFLQGQETPTVEALGLDADVDHLSYGWRAYFDFGAALVDWRAAVLSTGDGGA